MIFVLIAKSSLQLGPKLVGGSENSELFGEFLDVQLTVLVIWSAGFCWCSFFVVGYVFVFSSFGTLFLVILKN